MGYVDRGGPSSNGFPSGAVSIYLSCYLNDKKAGLTQQTASVLHCSDTFQVWRKTRIPLFVKSVVTTSPPDFRSDSLQKRDPGSTLVYFKLRSLDHRTVTPQRGRLSKHRHGGTCETTTGHHPPSPAALPVSPVTWSLGT